MAVSLMISFTSTGFSVGAVASDAANESSSAVYDKQFVSERISDNYSKVSAAYTSKPYSGEDIWLRYTDETAGYMTDDTMGYTASESVFDLHEGTRRRSSGISPKRRCML